MSTKQHLLLVCVVAAVLSLFIPIETATCLPSGIACYPSDCSTQFQQYVGVNTYPPQAVVPGALCYQGAIVNASDPVCNPTSFTTSLSSTSTISATTAITTASAATTTASATTWSATTGNLPLSTTGGSTTGSSDTVSGSLSLSDFNTLFPHANGAAIRGDVNQYSIFSYDNFIQAAQLFPTFATTGNSTIRKRELAAFLAQTSAETSAWWEGQPFVWGYFYSTEECESDCGYCYTGTDTPYTCVANQSYYGRGPMQLSWNYNYGKASEAIFGNLDLLNDPDMILKNGVIAFETALWFWMTAQLPKPSPHDIMTGNWTASSDDIAAGRVAGFGLTTDIINGGVECNIPTPSSGTARVGYYQTYTAYFNVPDGGNVYCDNMQPYGDAK